MDILRQVSVPIYFCTKKLWKWKYFIIMSSYPCVMGLGEINFFHFKYLNIIWIFISIFIAKDS